jgi:hypothetical protein
LKRGRVSDCVLILLLLLPNNDLLQQFEDYVIELRCEKEGEKKYNKKISLKICTKQGMNLRVRCGNGSPEGLD